MAEHYCVSLNGITEFKPSDETVGHTEDNNKRQHNIVSFFIETLNPLLFFQTELLPATSLACFVWIHVWN